MKLLVVVLASAAMSWTPATALDAADMGSVHLRVHADNTKGGDCTITNESQCDGQNWSGSTCCADSSYECRWDDYGQNVKRCQKKGTTPTPPVSGSESDWTSNSDSHYDDSYIDSESNSDSDSYSDSIDSDSGSSAIDDEDFVYVQDWQDCTASNVLCESDTSWCVYHSQYYAQCKPETLPSGELCGQDDGTNVWMYDACPTGETCQPKGTDYRCTKTNHHHKKAGGSGTTYVDVWQACTDKNTKCKSGSVCVKYSPYYSQCKPTTLPAGELCGQNDGTNVWKYDHCTAGETCKQLGTDFRCSKTNHHKKAGGSGTTYVDVWQACTDKNTKCKSGSVCVKYSPYYSQCKPTTLPAGELCGQNDGTNVWKYDHCPANQKCKQLGTDYRCS